MRILIGEQQKVRNYIDLNQSEKAPSRAGGTLPISVRDDYVWPELREGGDSEALTVAFPRPISCSEGKLAIAGDSKMLRRRKSSFANYLTSPSMISDSS